MSDQNPPEPENSLTRTGGMGIIRHSAEASPALSEIINRSLVHIQTSKALTVPVRRAGEEQEFEITPGVKIVMCWIPPGNFLMGSPEDEVGRSDDETQHRVTLTQGFWLGKYQVTQAQWEAVMGSNPNDFKDSNLILRSVSWIDIADAGGFMDKINHFASAKGIFSLPTEAQWEYACRAGTTSALNNGKNLTIEDGRCPNLDEVAWYWENSEFEMPPAGQKKANAWGLHDMHGNVWEWCADCYGYYANNPLVDPRGPSSGRDRVLRGGGWGMLGSSADCRSARRFSLPPNLAVSIGFRIARSSAASTLTGKNEQSEADEQAANAVHVNTSKTLGRLHRIGEHELQWPDYQLVCFWAEQLSILPVEVLMILLDHSASQTDMLETKLVNGHLINLVANERLAGITCLPAIEGLRIEKLNLLRLDLCALDLSSLPYLTSLDCSGNQLTVLDLTLVPYLTSLECSENRLTVIDLSPVPNLTRLECSENQLTDLNLSKVPNLTYLWHSRNNLTNLDLSPVPNLKVLGCPSNKLTELDLSHVPALNTLNCRSNKLTVLELFPMPALTFLDCAKNQLTFLDLTRVPALTFLICDRNGLTHIDLSQVPNLTNLWCYGNQLTELDIRPLHRLKTLIYASIRPKISLIQRPDQNFQK
jgi:formylglycine-generating enzyme required for sulfatase activity